MAAPLSTAPPRTTPPSTLASAARSETAVLAVTVVAEATWTLDLLFSWIALLQAMAVLRPQVDHAHPHRTDEEAEQLLALLLGFVGGGMIVNVASCGLVFFLWCLPRFVLVRAMVVGIVFLMAVAPFCVAAAVPSVYAIEAVVRSEWYNASTDTLRPSDLTALEVGVMGTVTAKLAHVLSLLVLASYRVRFD